MNNAPIAFFTYNRPEHTHNSLMSLAENPEAKESELFVFCDAPKEKEHEKGVEEVRQIVRSRQWCGSVHVVERMENLGCAKSIIDGVTRICETFGKIIVIEDDLVLSPHFLGYMNKALDLYEQDQRVVQISGHMFPIRFDNDTDAIFLPFISSWGWATWQRAWKLFDPDMSGYEKIKKNNKLRHKFDINGSYNYSDMMEAQKDGKIDSWAIRWYMSTFLNDGLTLYPVKTLVENKGFDGSGVHCPASLHPSGVSPEAPLHNFPRSIGVEQKDLDKVAAYFHELQKGPATFSLLRRIRNLMRSL